MTRFVVLFFVLVAVLFGVELARPVQAALVVPWTEQLARLSAWIITAFDPRVSAHGTVLQSLRNGFAVSIEAGCNGVEASLILVSAMVAFPAPWRHRLVGVALGILAVQLLNLVRVVSLFYLGQWNVQAFEWAHLYLWQALIMLDALVVWLLWMRALPARAADAR